MTMFNPPINIVEIRSGHDFHDFKDTWGSVESGDTLVYSNGASYYVDDIPIREPSQVTLSVRCVVGPPDETMTFGEEGMFCVATREKLPHTITIIKPRRSSPSDI